MKKICFFLLFALLPLVTNAGCFVQIQATNVTCNGDSNGTATAIPGGPGPFTFLWSPGNMTTQSVSNLHPGTYTVTVIDGNSCTSTATVSITEPPPLLSGFLITNASCSNCCDGSIIANVQGGTPGYIYYWFSNTSETSNTLQGVCPGIEPMCVYDTNGCQICYAIPVSFSTGVQEFAENGDLNVFPVPAVEMVNIQKSFNVPVSAEVKVTNMLGETLYSKSITDVATLNETINIAAFAKGVYFISVKTSIGCSVKRIIKE
ncbi:hypothetical protein BH11BAC7_BH11BAC7_08880 [soil metagenome]